MLAFNDIVIGYVFSENVTMQETVTLNTHEQKRVLVLKRILEGQLSTAEAAPLLKLSERQVQRLLATYRKEGVAAVVHGNRGRSPQQRIDKATRQRIIVMAQRTYARANYQHLRDLLEERESIVVSRASVRRIVQPVLAPGLPERKRPKHLSPRHFSYPEKSRKQARGEREGRKSERSTCKRRELVLLSGKTNFTEKGGVP